MRITQSAISLNVADVERSAAFLETHFGFQRAMEAPGFISLGREDAGFNLIFLEVGLASFKPATHAAAAGMGLLIAFVVDEIDAEWERLQGLNLVVSDLHRNRAMGRAVFPGARSERHHLSVGAVDLRRTQLY